MPEIFRLNLGCGDHPVDGWTNVDLYVEGPGVIKGDIRNMTYEDVDEVLMSHVLEHMPWADSLPVLKRVRSWMKDGARITVEVPDMVRILAEGTRHPDWQSFVFGSQQHPGEFHMAGFSAQTLYDILERAQFSDVHVKIFTSVHPYRPGLPCLEGTARA